MKLQKTTLGLLISAIVLSLGVAGYEFLAKPQQEEIQADSQQIFDFQEEDIQSFNIQYNQETLQFERIIDQETTWKMVKPKQINANDAVISFLLNLLVNGESERRFTVTNSQLKDYGLDSPLATIRINLTDNQKHQLTLGESDFQDKFIYARIDNDNEILLVSKDFQFAVERDLEEWQEIEPEATQETPSSSTSD